MHFEHLDASRSEERFEFKGRGKTMTRDVTGRKKEILFGLSKGPRIEPELPRCQGFHAHLSRRSVAKGKGMEKVRGRSERHTGKKRKIVAGLQQPEVLLNRGRFPFERGQRVVGGDAMEQFVLIGQLLFQEGIEQRQLHWSNGGTVGARGEQVVGMFGDEQPGIGVRFRNDADRSLAHGKIVG